MGVAYIDESVRLTGPQPMYLLGATLFADGSSEDVERLAKQKVPGASKMHWREMGRKAQTKSLKAVASTDAITTVVIATPVNPRKQERSRRKCMEALLPILENQGVHSAIMESRNPIQDARDIKMVDIMRSNGSLADFSVEHMRGEVEPRLWYPDLVLGAYGDMLCEDALPLAWVKAWESVEKKTVLHVITA